MKTKIINIIILSILSFSCTSQDEMVKITVSVNNQISISEVPANIEELDYEVGQLNNMEKIEGIEKLTELKKLRLQFGGNFSDYSMLSNFKKLEILILVYCKLDNLDFIKYMPKLKMLVVKNCWLLKNDFDLSYNKELKYFNLSGMLYQPFKDNSEPARPVVLNISGIPSGLEYIDLTYNGYIILTDKFLNQLLTIPHVIMGKINFESYAKIVKKGDRFIEHYKSYLENKDFLISHPNFILNDSIDDLPEKYQYKLLFKNPEDLE